MSVLLAGGVAGVYIAGVIGLHRLNVRRNRAAAGGFLPLGWLDWSCLLEGLASPGQLAPPDLLPSPPGKLGPRPRWAAPPPGTEARHALLQAVVAGAPVDEAVLEAEGFSGGQARWLRTLSLVKTRPTEALERLKSAKLGSAAELYLRERLSLGHRTHALNLELAVFSSKRRLTLGLSRFGEHPALFFVRAMASSLIGFNHAAIDDLARAVYFSHQAPFYLRAVAATPYIEEARPALARQCRLALYPSAQVG